MSARYRLTPRAYADLENIGRYTSRKWGKDQRNRYLTALARRFDWLAEQPHTGRRRPEIGEGYRSFLHASHIIFYRIGDGGIEIIGIPHATMDVEQYFG